MLVLELHTSMLVLETSHQHVSTRYFTPAS